MYRKTNSSQLSLIAAFSVIGYCSGGIDGFKNRVNKSKRIGNLACVSV